MSRLIVPVSDSEGPRRSAALLAWNFSLAALLALDVLFLYVNHPFHVALFEGELGIIELPTFFALAVGAVASARAALQERGRARLFFVLLALGCFYWGGEEVSWGQTFFHWATPDAYAHGNYQSETNLHNERGIVGTLLNVIPRFTLVTAMVTTVVLATPWSSRLQESFKRRLGPRWLAPLPWCIGPATLTLLSSGLNKLRPLGYRDYGENLELYMAVFLMVYALAQNRRTVADDRLRR